MEIDPGVQGLQALLSLACGPALGLVYDLMGEMRRRFGLEKLALPGDLLFCCLFACLLFLLGSVAGAGRLRLFMPLGMGLGGLVYLLLLRPAGRWLSRQAASLLLALSGIALLPGVLLLRFGEKIFKIAKNLFQYWRRWYKISYPQFCPAIETGRLEEGYETQKIGYRYEAYYPGAGSLRADRSGADEKPRGRRRGRAGRAAGRGAGADHHQRIPEL